MQSSASRRSAVELAEFVELAQFADFLPEERRAAYRDAVEKAAKKHRRLATLVDFLREAIGQLRLDAHYLIFDLEATRRERDAALRRRDG